MPTIAWIILIALFVLAHLWMHRGHGGHGGHGSHGRARPPAERAPEHQHASGGAPEGPAEPPPAGTTRERHSGC